MCTNKHQLDFETEKLDNLLVSLYYNFYWENTHKMKVSLFYLLFPILISISLIYFPSFWVSICILVDYYTPWVLFESNFYNMYHHFLVSRLPEREEYPIPTLSPEEATIENIEKLSRGYTFPIVIKGLLNDTPGVDAWGKSSFWKGKYIDEEVLCGTLSNVVEKCTVGTFFNELEEGRPFYISGASNIFDRHPELHDMIDSPVIQQMEPGTRTATQIFMGVPNMGSDIHCAIGVNIFRQITGEKKWWFIPTTQTAYLKPSINVNGFSAHTHTLVGKEGATPSPWLNKLERYTAVLSPGDVLFNPPWFWHGILNLGNETTNDLIIGAPTRYKGSKTLSAAFKTNPLFTTVALFTLFQNYGFASLKPDFKINLQGDIANNRRDREKKELVSEEYHPFDMAD